MRIATNDALRAPVSRYKIRKEAHSFYGDTELTWRYVYRVIFHWWYVNVLHFEARDQRPADGFMNILQNCIFCMYSILDCDQNFKLTESITYITSHEGKSHPCISAILTITNGHVERAEDVDFVR
mgnify:CR=1 FL=1